jgi:hypothetical protein
METITRGKAKELISKSNGKIFSAVFIKKDQTHRLINARLGKHYKSKTGKAAPYNAKEFDLLPVYDMRIKAFRMLNFNTLLTLSINKNNYKIK